MFSVKINVYKAGKPTRRSLVVKCWLLVMMYTCLTRRSPGIFSVGQQFRQARAADWKDPRLEALIAFLVMSRA
jgi:hypothetical protein